MRAEAQDHIDTINAALALVRRFLDWDRALRRLDELNAKVEDPTLWDNPKAAQEVMRERRRLDEAVTATRAIEKERDDTAELIELAELEGRSEEHTSELQSLMRSSYAVFCLKKKKLPMSTDRLRTATTCDPIKTN